MTRPSAMPRPWTIRHGAVLAAVLALLAVSAQRVELPRLLARLADGVAAAAGLSPADLSRAAPGGGAMARRLWPPQVSERVDTATIEGFDPARLPLFSHLETSQAMEREFDPVSLRPRVVSRTRVWLVHPFGYVVHVAGKMLETVEIAVWGTLLAAAVGLPLGLAGARPLVRSSPLRQLARAIGAMLRAVPELLSALFLVTVFGFGPPVGILALGLHAGGFLGRFYADAIEDANQSPVRALQAMGARQIATFRFALLPQVRAPFVSSTFYILDRNVRMATVVGLVGAGGIGQELKGRIDMYEYAHVATILAAILVVVLLLDRVADRLRRRKT